jgi:SAM-dependent methyltransferase
MATGDWISFWNSQHSIYVNARHHDAHYRRIAQDILKYVPEGGAVLDYGSGEAFSANLVAQKAGRLVLCEAAANVRAAIARRFAQEPKIEALAPDDLRAMPDASFDLIVMHSVAQYLKADELDAMLGLFHRLLKPGGLLVLGDIIPVKVSAATDALALLRFGARDGFFVAAVTGLARTAFSSYWRLRSSLGLSRYDEAAMLARLRAAGYLPKRAGDNIGHNPARMTFLGWPT